MKRWRTLRHSYAFYHSSCVCWTHMRTTKRDTRIRKPLNPSKISQDILSMITLFRMPTTRYLMLKVAYHKPMSSPWVVRGAWALMNSNTVIETSREERPLRSWGIMNHRSGVVEWVIVLLTIKDMVYIFTPSTNNVALSTGRIMCSIRNNCVMLLPVCGVMVNNHYDIQDYLK